MKPVETAIVTFILAAILGFLVIAFGYVVYADQPDYLDREGATGMAVVFSTPHWAGSSSVPLPVS